MIIPASGGTMEMTQKINDTQDTILNMLRRIHLHDSIDHEKPILLIEDDPMWSEFICKKIKKSFDGELQIHSCHNLQQADKLIDENDYCAVVLDETLEAGEKGSDFYIKCRQDHNYVPMIFFTSAEEKYLTNSLINRMDNTLTPVILNKKKGTSQLVKEIALYTDHALASEKKVEISNPSANYRVAFLALLTVCIVTSIPMQYKTIVKVQNEIPMLLNKTELIKQEQQKKPNFKKLENRRKFDVNKIITPELKARIERITLQADKAMNRTAKMMAEGKITSKKN